MATFEGKWLTLCLFFSCFPSPKPRQRVKAKQQHLLTLNDCRNVHNRIRMVYPCLRSFTSRAARKSRKKLGSTGRASLALLVADWWRKDFVAYTVLNYSFFSSFALKYNTREYLFVQVNERITFQSISEWMNVWMNRWIKDVINRRKKLDECWNLLTFNSRITPTKVVMTMMKSNTFQKSRK